jgi:hypothetical protein
MRQSRRQSIKCTVTVTPKFTKAFAFSVIARRREPRSRHAPTTDEAIKTPESTLPPGLPRRRWCEIAASLPPPRNDGDEQSLNFESSSKVNAPLFAGLPDWPYQNRTSMPQTGERRCRAEQFLIRRHVSATTMASPQTCGRASATPSAAGARRINRIDDCRLLKVRLFPALRSRSQP